MRRAREIALRFLSKTYRPVGILAIASVWVTILFGTLNREKLAALAGAVTYVLLGLTIFFRALVPVSQRLVPRGEPGGRSRHPRSTRDYARHVRRPARGLDSAD